MILKIKMTASALSLRLRAGNGMNMRIIAVINNNKLTGNIS